MVSSAEILTAFREVSNTKQLDRAELYGLLQDGIMAALAKKYGPTVQAEVTIDDAKGDIRIVLLKTVVDDVQDPSREVSLEEARAFDEGFEVGDVLEEPVDFAVFGRAAVQAAKQRIIQRVREGERTRIRDEFTTRVGELLSGEVQQIERGKLVIMLNKFR
jgi:N utilization substance protein A